MISDIPEETERAVDTLQLSKQRRLGVERVGEIKVSLGYAQLGPKEKPHTPKERV